MFRDVPPNLRRAAKMPRVEDALNNFERTNIERERARICFRKSFSNIHRISESFPFVSAAWRINQATTKKHGASSRLISSELQFPGWKGERGMGGGDTVCRLYGTPCPADTQRVRMNRLRRAAGQMGTLSRFCDLVPELPEFYALLPPTFSFPSTCPRFLDIFSSSYCVNRPRRSRFLQRFRRLSSIE